MKPKHICNEQKIFIGKGKRADEISSNSLNKINKKYKQKALFFDNKSIIFIFLSIFLLFGCTSRQNEQTISGTRSYKDFINTGKRFGVEAGDVYGGLARDYFGARSVTESINIADLFGQLRGGRIDAILVGHQYLPQLQTNRLNEDFEYLWVPEDVFLKESAFVFHTETLRDTYNEWFYSIVDDGTYQSILDRWLGASVPDLEDIPRFEFTGENGILRVADTGNYPPLSYQDPQGNPIGFGADKISRFALHLGMRPEFTFMPYEAITPFVVAGNADMSAATKSLEDERKEDMYFGEPSIVTRAVLIVRRGTRLNIDINDLIGQNIAVLMSALTYSTTQRIGGIPVIYNNTPSAIDDVRLGRVFGYMESLSFLRSSIALMGSDLFDVIPIPKEIDCLTIAAITNDDEILKSFNAFLSEIEANGDLQDMKEHWFRHEFDLDMSVTNSEFRIQNSVDVASAIVSSVTDDSALRVVISAEVIPYVFIDNGGNFSGYSVELALRFGAYLGRRVEFINVNFSELIPYVENGLADISIDRIGITEDRKRKVKFTNPISEDQLGVIFLRQYDGVVDTADYTNFISSRIGISMGSLSEGITRNYMRGIPVFYSNYSAGIADIRRGRIDGYMTDLVSLNLIAALPENADLAVHEIPAHIFSSPMGAFATNQEIINRFNVFLRDLERRGTLQQMQNRWFSASVNLDDEVSTASVIGRNGVLRVATSGEKPPYSYIGSNGRLNGYSIELARLFAASEDMIIRFSDMEFSALIPFVVAGRADIGLANVSITEERRRLVTFSEPIWYDTFGIIALGENSSEPIEDTSQVVITDFFEKRLGVMYGTMYDRMATEVLGAIPIVYNEFHVAEVDLNTGRISGFLLNESIAKMFADVSALDYQVIELKHSDLFIARVSAIAISPEVLDRFNLFVANLSNEGTLAEIQDRWMRNVSIHSSQMPIIPLVRGNEVLRVATSGKTRPFSFYDENHDPFGFCIEMARRFAAGEGMTLELILLDLPEIIPFIRNGGADLGLDLFQIKSEFEEFVLYSDPIFQGNAAIIVLNETHVTLAHKIQDIIEYFSESIERNFIMHNRWQLLVEGFRLTMLISFASYILGTIFGCFIFFLCAHKNKFLKFIGTIYYEFICRTPNVVLLLIAFYILFARTTFSNVLIAIFVFTMIASTDIARCLKNAFSQINMQEKEIARSLGFTPFGAYVYVIYPQVVRHGIEEYTKGFIYILKTTAILGYIAIQDLTRAVEIIRSRTFDPFFPLLFATLIYILVISIFVYIFKYIAKRINTDKRHINPFQEGVIR